MEIGFLGARIPHMFTPERGWQIAVKRPDGHTRALRLTPGMPPQVEGPGFRIWQSLDPLPAAHARFGVEG